MTRAPAALLLAVCLVFSGCAAAPSPGATFVPTTPAPALSPVPQWVLDANAAADLKLIRNFSNSDMERFYPKQALARAIEGNVLLMCDWNEAGSMTTCRVLEETPLGEGFGAAAVDMVKARVLVAPKGEGPLHAGSNWPVIIRWKMG